MTGHICQNIGFSQNEGPWTNPSSSQIGSNITCKVWPVAAPFLGLVAGVTGGLNIGYIILQSDEW